MSNETSSSTYTKQQLRQEIIILILCVLLLVVIGRVIYSKIFSPETQVVINQVEPASKPAEVIPVQEFTGTVVSVSKEKDYFRLAVDANQIFSIGLELSSNEFLSAYENNPTALVTVTVTKEKSSALNDFLMKDFSFAQSSETVEGRIKRTELENNSANSNI